MKKSSERAFVLKIIKTIEKVFGCIAYGVHDQTPSGSYKWWTICIDNAKVYMSDNRFKSLIKAWHTESKKNGYSLLFAYCNPSEENLKEFAKHDRLILNV
jgi:hypothetical protein